MKLSPEQEKAVCHVNGPILIFAGAGSGKTRVISNRIAHLIESVGVPAGKIVALSFTNKSAREMEERVRKMIPKQKLKGIVLSTFHSLGLNILKKHIALLGYKQPFLLMNQNDQEGFLTTLLIANKIELKKRKFPKSSERSPGSKTRTLPTGNIWIRRFWNPIRSPI